MPDPSLGITWGVITVVAALLILAASVVSGVIIHCRRIKESECRFRRMFNGVIDANFLIDERGRIVDVNESACDLLGYSKKDLLKLSLKNLVPEEKWSELHADIDKIFESGLEYKGESELIRKNGGVIQVEAGGVRIRIEKDSFVLKSFRDISERRHAEDALRESEEHYRAVWEYSPVGICLTDKDGIYRYANPAYCKIYGYSERELIGRPYYELIIKSGDSEARRQRHNKLFEKGKPLSVGETEFIRKDGKSIWIQYTGDFVRGNGVPKYMVSMNIDITEQKRVYQALNEEKRLLQEKNITLKQVLGHLEEEKQKIKREVAEIVDHVLMPVLHKLINDDGTVDMPRYKALKNNLRELAASSGGIAHLFSKLTSREIEICSLIKSGATSKEISRTLSLSSLTVDKHRQRIRRKLVISDKDTNLASFLRNLH